MQSAKINISADADVALERMLAVANDGFHGGRVTKQQLASWVLIRFEVQHILDALEALRKDHFDEISYLEAMVSDMKAARRSGQPLADIKARLSLLAAGQRGASTKRKRKADEASSDSGTALGVKH